MFLNGTKSQFLRNMIVARLTVENPPSTSFCSSTLERTTTGGASKTFLAISNSDSKTIPGFYSLSPASLEYAITPDVLKKGLARYDVPVFRLARLAVNLSSQGEGLGGQLILAAGRRCLLAASEVGGVAILIDAKCTRAAKWYASYGAIPLKDAPLTLVLPLSTIATALKVDR